MWRVAITCTLLILCAEALLQEGGGGGDEDEPPEGYVVGSNDSQIWRNTTIALTHLRGPQATAAFWSKMSSFFDSDPRDLLRGSVNSLVDPSPSSSSSSLLTLSVFCASLTEFPKLQDTYHLYAVLSFPSPLPIINDGSAAVLFQLHLSPSYHSQVMSLTPSSASSIVLELPLIDLTKLAGSITTSGGVSPTQLVLALRSDEGFVSDVTRSGSSSWCADWNNTIPQSTDDDDPEAQWNAKIMKTLHIFVVLLGIALLGGLAMLIIQLRRSSFCNHRSNSSNGNNGNTINSKRKKKKVFPHSSLCHLPQTPSEYMTLATSGFTPAMAHVQAYGLSQMQHQQLLMQAQKQQEQLPMVTIVPIALMPPPSSSFAIIDQV